MLAGLAPAQELEPDLARALAEARALLPEFLAAKVAHVEISEKALEMPAEAPLALRLVAAGAYAFYDHGTERVHVTPADRQAPEVSAEELQPLLAELLPDTGWPGFVELVRQWNLAGFPEGTPPYADKAVLDLFVQHAGEQAMDEAAPLTHLVLHELMHALEGERPNRETILRSWCTVTGWWDVEEDCTADGHFGGLPIQEDPAVLIGLVLDGTRRPGRFELRSEAPTTYAGYDPQEDFAESGRLMATDPERLDPARYLFLNALPILEGGDSLWHADPDPQTVNVGASKVFVRSFRAVNGDATAVAGILRAHGPWIEGKWVLDVGPCPIPPDLPPGVATPGEFEYPIQDGSMRTVPHSLVRDTWSRRAFSWHLEEEVARELAGWPAEELPTYEPHDDPSQRAALAHQRLIALEGMGHLGATADFLQSESRALIDLGAPLAAARLRLVAGEGTEEERVNAALSAIPPGDVSFDGVELRFFAARELLGEDPERARRIAATIPGEHWGALRRAELYLALGRGDLSRVAARNCKLYALRVKYE